MITPSHPISSIRQHFETTITSSPIPKDIVTIVLEYLFFPVKLNAGGVVFTSFHASEGEDGDVTMEAWSECKGKIGELVFNFFNERTSSEHRTHYSWFYGLETRPSDTVSVYGGVRLLGDEPVWKPESGNKIVIESNSDYPPCTSDERDLAAHLTQAAIEWGNERGCQNRVLIDVKSSYMEGFWYFMGFRSMREGVLCTTNTPSYLIENENIECRSITGIRDGGQDGVLYLPPTDEVNVVQRIRKAAERFASISEERVKALTQNTSSKDALTVLRSLYFDPEPPLVFSSVNPQ